MKKYARNTEENTRRIALRSVFCKQEANIRKKHAIRGLELIEFRSRKNQTKSLYCDYFSQKEEFI